MRHWSSDPPPLSVCLLVIIKTIVRTADGLSGTVELQQIGYKQQTREPPSPGKQPSAGMLALTLALGRCLAQPRALTHLMARYETLWSPLTSEHTSCEKRFDLRGLSPRWVSPVKPSVDYRPYSSYRSCQIGQHYRRYFLVLVVY